MQLPCYEYYKHRFIVTKNQKNLNLLEDVYKSEIFYLLDNLNLIQSPLVIPFAVMYWLPPSKLYTSNPCI